MNHNQASILEPDEVAQALRTDLSHGLTSVEARERFKRYGPNKLEETNSSCKIVRKLVFQEIIKYLSQFMNPLIQLLVICIIISLAIGEFESAISVFLAITIVCTISYIQERRADKSLEKLNKQMPNMCKVMRENQAHELESHLLVPGDIIYLNEGQRVPADVRLFNTQSLTVNESNLTGETYSQVKITSSTANKKRMTSVLSGDTQLFMESNNNNNNSNNDNHNSTSSSTVSNTTIVCNEDKNFIYQNLALMGTLIESGNSMGIVICTGKSTRYGEVYCLLKTTIQPKSPLQNNIDQLSIHLVVISCSIIALISIVGIVQQRQILEVAYFAISLAVTAIPEGLPVVVAVIMALGVLRLSKQKTIVKSLNSIETLGCIQVLCADKTGTLTRNDMTLTDVVTSELHSLSSDELEELNNEECKKQMTFNKLGGKMYSIGRLMEVGTLCNNASLDPNEPEGSLNRYIGQATECAILDASIRMGFGDSRTKFDRISELPFKSTLRRMVVQCQRRDLSGSSPMFYVKGAWEEILNDCTHYYECGLIKARTDEIWLEYVRICTTLGGQGLRVLAFATGPTMDQLTFVGIVGINNALRDGMTTTINKLKNDFHINIKMITGDSKDTAIAIGKSLGLIEAKTEFEIEKFIMSGEQVYKLLNDNHITSSGQKNLSGDNYQIELDKDKEELEKAIKLFNKSIFYRVDPILKAEIVRKIQQLDKIVAMTGDGINDVISLKRANLSLVMSSGADVCKEIADIIVVDDNLSVLIKAVVEGKGIYHKIHSFMSFQISISLTLVLLVAISFATRLPAPFTVIQLLSINILTDGPLAQTLGVEKVYEKDLDLKPRNVHQPILNKQLVEKLITLTLALFVTNGSLFYTLLDDGQLDTKAKSLLFTCIVLCAIFAAISLRSKAKTVFETHAFGNMELFYCSIVVILTLVCILNFKFLNNIFEVEPLSLLELLLIFVYASIVLIIMDSMKIIKRLWKYMRKDKKLNGSKV